MKLVDFGIAKVLEEGRSFSGRTTTVLMTPDYASPEQIRGESTSTLTDVYSLGVLMYELLAGRRPFEGPMHEVLRQICDVDPARPSLALRELRGDLDNIILKALARGPKRRYSSVEQLDGDLQGFLFDQPVLARGDSTVYRARKFLLRIGFRS